MPTILNLPTLTTATGEMVFPIVDVTAVGGPATKKATLDVFKDYVIATAPRGYSGSVGGLGYAGSQGPQGYIGSASTAEGPQGSQGYVGSTGAGYTGSSGIGYAGSVGATGNTGYTGSLGIGYAGSAGKGISNFGDVLLTTTTNSVSTITGGIVTYGGLGIGKDVYIGGTTTANGFISNSPNSTYDLDVSGTAASYAANDTVTFTGFSGMIIVNNWGPGTVAMFLVGGGGVSQIGTATNVGSVGSIAFSGGNYVWTNTTGVTGTFSFAAVRTRNNS